MSAQNTIERVFTLEKELQEFITDCRNREHSESYLISVLHKVQARYGFLSQDHMQEVAELLGVPASTVSGVATFYHFFRLQPQGKYKVSFCMGTACYVKGAPGIIDAFKEELGVDIGETTKDGSSHWRSPAARSLRSGTGCDDQRDRTRQIDARIRSRIDRRDQKKRRGLNPHGDLPIPGWSVYLCAVCECSSTVEPQPSKLLTRVRLPSLAQRTQVAPWCGLRSFFLDEWRPAPVRVTDTGPTGAQAGCVSGASLMGW